METYIDVDCDDYGKEFNTPRFHFVSKNYESVYDYCHYAGKYRAAAHSICNLRDKTSKEILVIFHNVLQYDYHFIVTLGGRIWKAIWMYWRKHWEMHNIRRAKPKAKNGKP